MKAICASDKCFGLSASVWERHDALMLRRQGENLSEMQHAELLQIAAQIEENHVEQIRPAAQLARLQNKPLPVIMLLWEKSVLACVLCLPPK